MPKNKTRSDGEKSVQKERTRANKLKRYQKLLENNPNHPHTKKWREQIEYNNK